MKLRMISTCNFILTLKWNRNFSLFVKNIESFTDLLVHILGLRWHYNCVSLLCQTFVCLDVLFSHNKLSCKHSVLLFQCLVYLLQCLSLRLRLHNDGLCFAFCNKNLRLSIRISNIVSCNHFTLRHQNICPLFPLTVRLTVHCCLNFWRRLNVLDLISDRMDTPFLRFSRNSLHDTLI